MCWKLLLYILVPIQNKTVIFIPLSKIKKSRHKFITRSEACPTWRLQTRSRTWAVLGCFMERVSQPSTLTLKPDLSMRVWFGCHHKWSCNKPNQQIPSATGSIVVRCQAAITFLSVYPSLTEKLDSLSGCYMNSTGPSIDKFLFKLSVIAMRRTIHMTWTCRSSVDMVICTRLTERSIELASPTSGWRCGGTDVTFRTCPSYLKRL